MNEKPSPQPRRMRWKWFLGIAATAVLFTILALVALLSTIDFNTLKTFLAQVIKQETGRELEIRGAIDFKLGLRPSVVMDDLVFQNAPWAFRPEMIKIKRLEAKVSVLPLLNGEIHVSRLVLSEPDVLVETDKAGKWNFEFEKPESSPEKDKSSEGFTLPKIAFHEVEVQKGKVSYRDEEAAISCCLLIKRFTACSKGIDSPIDVSFSGEYRDTPLELRGTVGSILLLKEPGTGYPVDLTAMVSSAQLRVQGMIRDLINLKGLALKASAEIRSTARLAALLGQPRPVEIGPLRASALISDRGEKTYELSDLKISSKAGDAGGSVMVHLADRRPKLSGTVVSQNINLKAFFSDEKTKQGKAEKSKARSRVFPRDPLPLEVLKRMDLEIKCEANRVQLAHLCLGSLSTEVRVDDGLLALKSIKVQVAGGDAEGEVDVQVQGRVAIAKAVFRAHQMDLRQLSPDWNAEGKVDVDLDLLSRGSSIAGLMAGLNGRTVVVMGQGRVDNRTIQAIAGDLASDVIRHFSPSSKAANQNDINCGVSGFEIEDGIARVTALVVDTPDMTVVGEGEVNLKEETLDLALKPYSKGGAAGFNLSLVELAKSFKLGGTLAAPSLQVNAEQTMFSALKAAGGILLLGPAGIVVVLVSQSSGGDNPCLAAMETVKNGVKETPNHRADGSNGTVDKSLAKALKGVGESVKQFFIVQGKQSQVNMCSDPYGGAGP